MKCVVNKTQKFNCWFLASLGLRDV